MATSRHAQVILVIELDHALGHFLTQSLQWAGFAVVATATGPQALAALASRAVDLVLANAHLHGLSGAEVLQKLRDREARHRLSPIPFILLSNEPDLTAAPALRLPLTVSAGELISAVTGLLASAKLPQPLVP